MRKRPCITNVVLTGLGPPSREMVSGSYDRTVASSHPYHTRVRAFAICTPLDHTLPVLSYRITKDLDASIASLPISRSAPLGKK